MVCIPIRRLRVKGYTPTVSIILSPIKDPGGAQRWGRVPTCPRVNVLEPEHNINTWLVAIPQALPLDEEPASRGSDWPLGGPPSPLCQEGWVFICGCIRLEPGLMLSSQHGLWLRFQLIPEGRRQKGGLQHAGPCPRCRIVLGKADPIPAFLSIGHTSKGEGSGGP